MSFDSLKSEIRGMFLHMWWWRITDIDAVLDTCVQNGMIHYVDVDYIGGTVMEDTTLQTIHQMTIPITPSVPTYFRIQSISSQGQIATSKVYSTA